MLRFDERSAGDATSADTQRSSPSMRAAADQARRPSTPKPVADDMRPAIVRAPEDAGRVVDEWIAAPDAREVASREVVYEQVP